MTANSGEAGAASDFGEPQPAALKVIDNARTAVIAFLMLIFYPPSGFSDSKQNMFGFIVQTSPHFVNTFT